MPRDPSTRCGLPTAPPAPRSIAGACSCRSRKGRAGSEARPPPRRARDGRGRWCLSDSSSRPLAARRWTDRPSLHPDLLVDEGEGVRAAVLEGRPVDSRLDHAVEEILPARVRHGADAQGESVTRDHDAVALHGGAGVREEIVGHLRVVALDEGIGRAGVAVEIAVPAFDGGVDEALHERRLVAYHGHASLDRGGVAGVAAVGQEHHHRLHARLLGHEGLAGEIALLYRLLVGEKGCELEGVRTDLIVGVAVALLEELPERGFAAGRDHDGLALELGERVVALAGMRHEDLRILLEYCGHGDDGHAAAHVVEGAEEAPAHVEVETAHSEELGTVDLRPALPD